MNENEINRIAAMGNALRPDWPISSLVTLLNRPGLVNRTRRDAAVALAWIACDSATKTPARVLEAGPWWQAVADPSESGRSQVDWRDRCQTCNYPEATCRRLRENDPDDPHEFVRKGDVEEGRVKPPPASPMPAALRRVLRGLPAEDDKR